MTPRLPHVPKVRKNATLSLSDGTALKGYFFVDATVRIQDLLNGEREFLPFVDDDETFYLINRHQIVSVRPGD